MRTRQNSPRIFRVQIDCSHLASCRGIYIHGQELSEKSWLQDPGASAGKTGSEPSQRLNSFHETRVSKLFIPITPLTVFRRGLHNCERYHIRLSLEQKVRFHIPVFFVYILTFRYSFDLIFYDFCHIDGL